MLSSLTAALPDLIATYGYIAVGAIVALESMGIPLPGETALVSAALYAGATHNLSILGIVAAAAAGAVLGDNVGYGVGYGIGFPLLVKYGHLVRMTEPRIKLGRYLFQLHGGKVVFWGRFVAILRTLAAFLAGANQMSWKRFFAFNIAGGAAWAILYGGGAYLFGREIHQFLGPIAVVLAAVALGLVVMGTAFVRRHEQTLQRAAARAFPDPLTSEHQDGWLWKWLVDHDEGLGGIIASALRWGVQEVVLLSGLFASAVLALFFAKIAVDVGEGDAKAFDRFVLLLFRRADDPSALIGPPWMHQVGRDITSLGGYAVLTILVIVVTGYLLIARKHRAAVFLLVAVMGGSAISSLLKAVFERARPDIVSHATEVFTYSFPSGHSTLSAVVYLTMAALLTRVERSPRVRTYFMGVAVALTILVGVSRVYLGVHWPTDVLAGWSIGAAWAVLCWAVAARMQRTGGVEPPEGSSRAG